MTIPDVFYLFVEFLKGEKGGRIEASVVAGLIGLFLSGYFKRKRLKLAIKTEIQIIMKSYAENLTYNNKKELTQYIKADPEYRVLLLTSQKRTIIGNLDDDISYLKGRTIKALIEFNDLAELVDDALRVLRSDTFSTLSERRKLALLDVPFHHLTELVELERTLSRDL